MTSKLGKQVIPQEARLLLQSFKNVVAKIEGPKKAKEIESNIIKLIVKAKICIDDKKVSEQDFLKADVPLRKAFNLIVDLYDYFGEKVSDKVKQKFQQVSSLMGEVSVILNNVFKPHVQLKSLNKLKAVFEILSNTEFYTKVWGHPEITKDMEELIDAMNKYTQFNF